MKKYYKCKCGDLILPIVAIRGEKLEELYNIQKIYD